MINLQELTKMKKLEEAVRRNTQVTSETCIAIKKSNGTIRQALKDDKEKES